jgi:parallel beta-helix repeat protein
MRRNKILNTILCIVLIATVFAVAVPMNASAAAPTTVWVDDDYTSSTPGWGVDHFDKIQNGINAVATGGTVFVYTGTYYEHVTIRKTLTLQGEDRSTTIIDGGGGGTVVYVRADYVSISGFTVQKGYYGIRFWGISNYNTISNNNISNNSDGIRSEWSLNYNTISSNNIYSNNVYGISLSSSSNNIISNNNIYSNNFDGITLHLSSNYNTISNNNISNNGLGIRLYSSSNYNTISNSNISKNNYGISLNSNSHNTISNNNIHSNNFDGIYLRWGSSNTISNNNIHSHNGFGILVLSSSNNSVLDNTFQGDGIFIYGDLIQNWNTHTITNNIANGRPIYYYKNMSGVTVPQDAIEVILGNCTNFTIQGINASNVDVGIQLGFSDGNTISNNKISDNFVGIQLRSSSNYNTISNSKISNNQYGIYLHSSSNIIFHNNIIDNTNQAYDTNPANNDWHHPVLLEGNYWSDYTGLDDGSGTGKHAIAGDGIGDTAIPHPGRDFDFYPLMKPWSTGCSIDKLIKDIEDMGLHHGIENSLISKLNNVKKSIDKGQNNSAKNILEAFINEVEAQSGKKITNDQADDLIATAECILKKIK